MKDLQFDYDIPEEMTTEEAEISLFFIFFDFFLLIFATIDSCS